MATLTLNQIVKRLKTAAESHKQIATFINTDYLEEYMTEPDRVQYPVCVSVLQDPIISRVTKATEHPFKIYFLDLVNVASDTKANQADVYSDMMEIAKDFVALLQNNDWRFDWEIGKNTPVQTIRDGSEDVVCGVCVTISIFTAFTADRCQVPSTEIPDNPDIDMATSTLIKYTADGTEEGSVQLSATLSKRILGIWRDGIYKRWVAGTPANTQEIQFDSTTGQFILFTNDIFNANEQLDILVYG